MIFSENEKIALKKSLQSFQERLFNRNILLKALPSGFRLDLTNIFDGISQSDVVVKGQNEKDTICLNLEKLFEYIFDDSIQEMSILRPTGSPKKPDSIISSMRKIQISGADYKQETGYNNIYIGYPFLFLPKDDSSDDSFIFAPLFLFEISLSVDRDKIKIKKSKDTLYFSNPILFEWLKFEKKITFDDLDFTSSNFLDFKSLLISKVKNIRGYSYDDLNKKVSLFPTKDELKNLSKKDDDPKIYNCAMIGEFKFAYKPILYDLRTLSEF